MASSPYRATRPTPDPDGECTLPRSSTDSLPTSHSGLDAQSRPTKLVRIDTGDSDELELELEDDVDQPPRLSLYDASWSEDVDDHSRDSAELQRERRRRNRRVYGGGRHRHHGDRDGEQDDEDDGGGGNEDMSVGEVAGLVVAGTLSPLPLLVPYACSALTPALFVPLLALSGVLAWSSAVALGVQGRYVGARSYPGLASAVFPHRFKLHLVGEFLASSFVLGGSIIRTTLGVVAASEVVVDLVVPERRRRDWERTVAVGVISLVWLVVPLALPPLLRFAGLVNPTSSNPVHHHYSRLASHSSPSLQHLPLPLTSTTSPNLGSASCSRRRPHWSALLLLPAYSLTFASWPLALLILGVRLKRLNQIALSTVTAGGGGGGGADLAQSLSSSSSLSSYGSSVPSLFAPVDNNGESLWPAILLTLAALSSTSHESFYYLTSLVRPDSTTRNKLAFPSSSSSSSRGILSRRGSAFVEFDEGSGMGMGEGASYDGTTSGPGGRELGGGGGGGGVDGGGGGGGPLGGANRRKVGKRNTFPLAMGIGILISFLVQLGWALVGTLGFAAVTTTEESRGGGGGHVGRVGPSGNLLSDPRLPRGDWWLGCVRVLVLVGILGQLEGHARVGIKRVRRGVAYFLTRSTTTTTTTNGRDQVRDDENGGPTTSSLMAPSSTSERLRSPLSRSLIFFIVSVLSLAVVTLPAPHRERFPDPDAGKGKREVGGHGIGLVYLAEWAGVGLSGLGCCLIPALTYLILFHLLPPRSILTTSTTTDPLLLAKERQIQRKLGGRRLWTDVAVFGVLGPVGVVVVVRGIWALL